MASGRSVWRTIFSVGTLVTGLLSAAFFGLHWNWAVGFWLVLLMYAHELGHVMVAHWRRIPVHRAPLFIPGMGAFVVVGGTMRPWDNVWLALGGPILGGAVALGAKLGGIALASPGLAFAGDLALILNLINLAPVPGLDGGRLAEQMGWLGYIPIILIAWLGISTRATLLVPLAIAGALLLAQRLRQGQPPASWGARVGIFGVHLLACGLLFLGIALTPRVRGPLTHTYGGYSLLSVAFYGGLLLYFVSGPALRHALSPGRSVLERYGLYTLLGWPRAVLRNPWFVAVSSCAMAHGLGLPGLVWLDRLLAFLARQGDTAAGFAFSVGYDCRARRNRAEADSWFTEMQPTVSAGGLDVIMAAHADLQHNGYRKAYELLSLALNGRCQPGELSAVAANNLAWALFLEKRPAEALPYARAAVALEPGRSSYQDTLGRVLVEVGDWAEGEGMLRASLKQVDLAGARVYLALALAGQERYTEALAEADQALYGPQKLTDEDPGPDEIRTWIAEWQQHSA